MTDRLHAIHGADVGFSCFRSGVAGTRFLGRFRGLSSKGAKPGQLSRLGCLVAFGQWPRVTHRRRVA